MSNPSVREAIDRVLADDRSALHTSFPARVLAYDATAQTLDVRPALLREVPSNLPGNPWGFEQLPDLLSVQVMWPRAGGFVITFPIAVGDWVLVLCAEQATSLWRKRAQAPSHPGLVDPHGLNGCVCLPGWFPDAEKLSNVSATDLVMGSTSPLGSTIAIKPNGDVVLGNALAQPVALATKLDAIFRAVTSLPLPSDPVSTTAWAAGFAVAVAVAYPGGMPQELGPVPPPAPGVPSPASIAATKVRAT